MMRCSSNKLDARGLFELSLADAGAGAAAVVGDTAPGCSGGEACSGGAAGGAGTSWGSLAGPAAAATAGCEAAAFFGVRAAGAGWASTDGACQRVTVSDTASDAKPPPRVPKHTHTTTLLTNDVAPAAAAVPSWPRWRQRP